MGPERPAPPSAKPRGRGPQLAAACAALCFGCASTTTRAPGGDAFAADDAALDVLDATAEAPADATAEARRCDPSVLADAGPLPDAPPPDGPHVVELSMGGHVCARMSDGTVRCRGRNPYGQLGDGTTEDRFDRAAPVDALADAAQVVTGIESTCARLGDGTVRCWGSNRSNRLGVSHEGDEPCRGERPARECRLRPVAVPGLTDVIHLASNFSAYCAVRRDGSVWCWGGPGFPSRETFGPSPAPIRIPGLDDIVWMRALLIGWIVRHRDGRQEVLLGIEQPPIPAEATIPDGSYNSHICYRLPDSSMRCSGTNANGKIGNGGSAWPGAVTTPWDPGLCGVRSVATGAYHTCAVLADHRIWCWGESSPRAPGEPPTERCAGIGSPSDCVTHPTLVEGIDQVELLFAGIGGTCAIRADRSVWCWGSVNARSAERPVRVEW